MSNFEHGAIYHNPDSFFKYCGWPTVCKDDEGTLYAVCSGFRVSHICPFGKTVLFKSFDEGKTWSIPMVINDTYLDDRDAGILCLGGKTMMVSWFCHPTSAYLNQYNEYIRGSSKCSLGMLDMYPEIPEDKQGGGSYIRVSHDGGMTWGDTVKVPVSAPHGPILRKDGSIFYLGKEMYSDGVENPGAIAAWESRDCGKTWSRLAKLSIPDGTVPNNFHEPYSVELPNGRIVGFIRAEGKEIGPVYTVYKSISDDGGKTWSEMTPLGISGSPPHAILHSSGTLVLSYARREKPCSERAMVSYDGGESFSEEITLCDSLLSDIGYPSTVELSDGSMLTVYYQQFGDDKYPSLLCTKWTL